MAVARYVPDFSQERHARYRNAFNTCTEIKDYYRVITKYLKDKRLSSSNEEDVEIFKDLLFESRFNKVHLDYANWLINWAKQRDSRLFLVGKYIGYICNVSAAHGGDFWAMLLSEKNKPLIEYLLKEGDSNIRLLLVEGALAHNPKIMKAVPKLKTYLIFS